MLKQNKTLIFIILLFLILNNFHHLFGFLQANKNKNLIYDIVNPLNVADYNVYLSMIEQGREGHLFTKLLYNHTATNNPLFSPHWYIIGQSANILNISTPMSYFLFRILLSIIFILLIWYLIKKIFFTKKDATMALVVVLFSNGLGMTLYPFFKNTNINPINLDLTDGISFLSMYTSPIFILSQILIISIFLFFIKGTLTKKKYFILCAAILNLLLVLIHPYDTITIVFVLTAWSLIKYYKEKRKIIFIYLLSIYISSVLGSTYHIWWLINDHVMSQWNSQNILTSGPLMDYIVGLGLISVLSFFGIIYICKKKIFTNDYLNLMVVWAILGWLLIYLPINFNRRLVNGWHVPLAITTAITLSLILKNKLTFRKYLLLFLIFLLLSADTSLFININYFKPKEYLFFHTRERQNIYDYIKNNSSEDDVIMARQIDANYLPAFTARKVYTGHPIGTWQDEKKSNEIKKIWSQKNDISDWLINNNIKFIFASKKYLNEFNQIKWLAQEKYIKVIVDDKDFVLYEVITF